MTVCIVCTCAACIRQFVSVHVSVHVSMHVSVHVSMHVSVHVSMHVSMHAYTYVVCACMRVYMYTIAKQKQPGCKKVRGQSEATMVISDQKL